jgi:WD40 repeat protein
MALGHRQPGPASAPPPAVLPRTTVHSLAFSPDSKTLAVGGGSGFTGEVWLWDVSDPAHSARIGPALSGPFLGVVSVTFGRTGDMLAFAGAARTISLWNVTSPAHPVPLSTVNGPASTFSVASVAISPDGQLLAAATRTTISLWRLSDPPHPTAPTPLAGPTNAVTSVAFAANGTMLAAGSLDAKVWLWSLADPTRPGPRR